MLGWDYFPLLGEVGGCIRCPILYCCSSSGVPYHFSLVFISFRISFGCLLFNFQGLYLYLERRREKQGYAICSQLEIL